MDKISRAVRRHHMVRLKRKRKSYYMAKGSRNQVGKVFHSPAICSCTMCGNPRKHFNRITLSELKSDISYHQDLREYF